MYSNLGLHSNSYTNFWTVTNPKTETNMVTVVVEVHKKHDLGATEDVRFHRESSYEAEELYKFRS